MKFLLITLFSINLILVNLAYADQESAVLSYPQPRDLWDEEKLGAYFDQLDLSDSYKAQPSCENYINKSENWLKSRLKKLSHLPVASSYYDSEIALRTIREIVFQNTAQIINWLNNPESNLQRQFVAELKEPVGFGFTRSDPDHLKTFDKARLVLAKQSNQIQVVNSYPIE